MLKHILHMLLLAACMLSPGMARGGTLSAEAAREVAAEFFRSGETTRLADVDALSLVHIESVGSSPKYYVFNSNDGQGFIIVSADDSVLPVIGYSTTSVWQTKAVPEIAGRLLGNVEMPKISTVRRMPARVATSGKKLLATAKWSQEAPFNNMIPNRRLVGCVGTALSEILKYHRYPVSRPASLVKDGEATVYDWANMRDDNYRSGYSAVEADAVATLVADAAIAIGTDFGMSSSSAFEVKVPAALVSHFGYDAGVSYKKSSEMDRASWDALVVNEIDNDRPVLYCGQDVSVGHAFVCDGYEFRGSVPYLHINWGWGGVADGYFVSDALNPTVSTSHNFSNLTTVVYNIKPATSISEWSPVHITSDERQVGMTIDVTDLQPGTKFTVRAGALKNISNQDFSGSISAALFGSDGTFKTLLGDGRKMGIMSLQIVKYTDMSFTVPADAAISDDDVVRLVTKDNAASSWLPVANDLMTLGEARAKGYTVPYFAVNIPASVDGVEISSPDSRVIKGRDFTFKVVPSSPDKVVTVKANGFILSPNADNTYRINNINSDQDVAVIVQNAADVVSKRNLWVQAGTLSQLVSDTDAGTITDLTLYGTINANDFSFMRDRMKLARLDISGVNIVAVGANPANAIPAKAFSGARSLRQIILPKNLNTFKSGCFSYSGLESIEIPASVATYEYNIFLGCGSLREVIARRYSPAWVNWCVFNGTPKARLVVPVGASAAYQNKDYWKDFREVVEENPVPATSYTVIVQDEPGVRFTPLTEGTEVAPGSQYKFMVETDDSYGDATMELYANNSRLIADASGVFTTVINANTLIHVNFKQPTPSSVVPSPWKITAAAGGIGLVTDVVNIIAGRQFTFRANALAIPSENASQFYCAALTDRDGRIKELISPIVVNSSYNYGNIPCNFTCQVKEASVREGNRICVVSSYDKKDWSIVHADGDSVADFIEAVGNRVVYHDITMPEKVEGAVIQGGASQVVRGMPFTLKVTPVLTSDRITVAVNGINKVVDAAIASLSIPSVTEDLDITIQVNPAGSDAYTVVNVREGELASKIAVCPAKLKVVGTMRSEDFDAFREHASTIVDLDLADVTIKGARDLENAIPGNAFASSNASVRTTLSTIILPSNLVNIEEYAFNRCVNISEITIPASVAYVGSGAFSTCTGLNKIIVQSKKPPLTGNMTPFPENTSAITLEVPSGSESLYLSASFWKDLNQTTGVDYFYIHMQPGRTYPHSSYYDYDRILYTGSKFTVSVGLPNYLNRYKPASLELYRPGVAFKIYDNNKDETKNSINRYMRYGQHEIEFNPAVQDPQYNTCPQNHNVEIVFHYPINFKLPEGVTAEFVDQDEANIWRDVDMSIFTEGSTARPTLYREACGYKFKVTTAAANVETMVKAVSRIMTKPGEFPEYSTVTVNLYPDEYGVYTIEDLQGDTNIEVTTNLVIEEGDVLAPGEVAMISDDDAKNIVNIGMSGEVTDGEFQELREKFTSLETLNLSEVENATLPDNAFTGMENLKSVVIPENVTSVGSNAFAGCSGLESITLPGVSEIGDSAFVGCSSLTSITVLGQPVNTGGDPALARRRAPGMAGITEDSFGGLNPNCLIYLSEGNESAIGSTRNVIINRDGSRVAYTDITLDGGYPFNAPASFSLADHTISLTVNIPGSIGDVNDCWRGIVLPFEPTSYEFGKEFDVRDGKTLSLLSFADGNAETMTEQTEIMPNRPYLANVHAPFDSVPVTFVAAGKSAADEFVYDVAFTPVPEEVKAQGKEFTLYGSLNGVKEGDVLYLLDEKGSAFCRVDADTVPAVGPFAAYMCANAAGASGSFGIGSHPVWVFDPASSVESGAVLYRSSSVALTSATAGAEILYTLDGSDPVESGTAYSEPFGITEENVTLKAIARFKGYNSEILSMNLGLRKTNVDYSLDEGWNWISHNVETEIPLSDIMNDKVDRVLSQTQEMIRDPKLGLVGTLSVLNPLEAYKVHVTGSNAPAAVNGISFDPANPVSLVKGWNWVGCPVEDASIAVSDAFANLEAEEGDMIVGREGFAQADADGRWVGDLRHLALGGGYMYLSGSAKEFVYNTVPSASAEVKMNISRPDVSYWNVESHKYPSVMPVISRIAKAGGVMATGDEYVVGAFCGNECRGVGVVVDGYIMISVYGNTGDEISFRIHSVAGHTESLLSQTMTFAEEPVGSLREPFVFDAASTTSLVGIHSDSYEVYVENGKLVVNGDAATVRLVEVYNVAGVRLAESSASMEVDNLAAGVYIAVIHTDNGHISHKIEVK